MEATTVRDLFFSGVLESVIVKTQKDEEKRLLYLIDSTKTTSCSRYALFSYRTVEDIKFLTYLISKDPINKNIDLFNIILTEDKFQFYNNSELSHVEFKNKNIEAIINGQIHNTAFTLELPIRKLSDIIQKTKIYIDWIIIYFESLSGKTIKQSYLFSDYYDISDILRQIPYSVDNGNYISNKIEVKSTQKENNLDDL